MNKALRAKALREKTEELVILIDKWMCTNPDVALKPGETPKLALWIENPVKPFGNIAEIASANDDLRAKALETKTTELMEPVDLWAHAHQYISLRSGEILKLNLWIEKPTGPVTKTAKFPRKITLSKPVTSTIEEWDMILACDFPDHVREALVYLSQNNNVITQEALSLHKSPQGIKMSPHSLDARIRPVDIPYRLRNEDGSKAYEEGREGDVYSLWKMAPKEY